MYLVDPRRPLTHVSTARLTVYLVVNVIILDPFTWCYILEVSGRSSRRPSLASQGVIQRTGLVEAFTYH